MTTGDEVREGEGILGDKPVTPLYKLVKPKPIHFYDVEDQNGNMDIIEAEIKRNAGELEKVKEDLGNINVTTDVEQVINRRVNSDTSKSLNTFIGEVKTSLENFIAVVRDNLRGHVTAENNRINTSINNNTNSARDNVKSHVTAEKNNILSAITGNRGAVKNVQRGVVDEAIPNNYQFYVKDIKIASVNMSRASVSASVGKSISYAFRLIDSTTLRVYVTFDRSLILPDTSNTTIFISWQVIEYY